MSQEIHEDVQRYSLLQIDKDHGDTVDGFWLQNVTGTYAEAVSVARETEKVNHNRFAVAIVEEVPSTTPLFDYWKGRTKI